MVNLVSRKPTFSESDIIASAKTAIQAIAGLNILATHKRELLSILLWKLTEARGKYRTRFVSAGAKDETDRRKLHHEHVVTRANLVREILASPERADEIADKAVGCVVTRQEHAQLAIVDRSNAELCGWDRYSAAGIRVWDRDEERFL